MAKSKSLQKNASFQGFIVLMVGALLGVIGYYFFLQARAGDATSAIPTGIDCVEAGGAISEDGTACEGGDLDGVTIEAGELP